MTFHIVTYTNLVYEANKYLLTSLFDEEYTDLITVDMSMLSEGLIVRSGEELTLALANRVFRNSVLMLADLNWSRMSTSTGLLALKASVSELEIRYCRHELFESRQLDKQAFYFACDALARSRFAKNG